MERRPLRPPKTRRAVSANVWYASATATFDATKRRFKTAEQVVDEIPWERTKRPDPTVRIRLTIDEVRVREAVKSAGGRWPPRERLWSLKFSELRRLRLPERIVAEETPSHADIYDG